MSSHFPRIAARVLCVLAVAACPAFAALAQAPVTKAPGAKAAPKGEPAKGPARPEPAKADSGKADPKALLAAAKTASGGDAWDALKTQHAVVKIGAAGMQGTAERWSDVLTGRALLRYAIGPISGALGNDGKVVWTQEGNDEPQVQTAPEALQLAANAAYRDRLAFWFPDRATATIEAKGRAEADGRTYEVVTVTPKGGRAFEFWLDAQTKLIARLVEKEGEVTRTEVYSDWREVQGVRIPFKVLTRRGDPKFDETQEVQSLAWNESLDKIAFSPPDVVQEIGFPEGRGAIEVPFEVQSGHLFVQVFLDGRGPFRMLLDAGGVNVITPQAAGAVKGDDKPVTQVVAIASTKIGDVELTGQRFTTANLEPFFKRVEGLDEIAGILGLEWFARMPIRIDYARGRITFYDPTTFKYAGGGTKVPVINRGRLPQVNGSLDGVDGVFEIDTGSRGSLTLTPAFAAKNDFAKKLGAKNVVVTGASVGGPVHALLARAKLLKLGTVEVPSPIVAIPQLEGEAAKTEVAGNVGFALMRQFAITYDLPNDVLYFERYLNFGSPDVADRGGLWLERGDDGFKVVEVVASGPAATAGLKAGDTIVEINGYPAGQVTLPSVREVLRGSVGSRVRVKTAAGADATIVLRDLM